jgi:aryl-alcohol dehydrogenase-like predicted oxidoreductase
MEYSKLGKTGIRISKICFGCWAIGGHGYGVVDDNESIAAIHEALDHGINFFDTADVYGFGHSEKVLGKALVKRDDVVIATKFGVAWDENGRTKKNCSVEHLHKSIGQSLKRLKREYIDLYQIHWYDGVTPIEKLIEALLKLKEQGKIRNIGCTNFSRDLIIQAIKITRIESAQFHYSLNNISREDDIHYLRNEYDLATLIYGVLARGFFSGKYNTGSVFAEKDTRKSDPNFNEYLERNITLLNYLKKIAAKYDKTPGQVAVRWALENPDVSSVLLGMKKTEQVLVNIKSLGWTLAEEDKSTLTKKSSTLFN